MHTAPPASHPYPPHFIKMGGSISISLAGYAAVVLLILDYVVVRDMGDQEWTGATSALAAQKYGWDQ